MATTFGEVARARRIEAGMPLRTVAVTLGFTAAYISDMERGNRSAPAVRVARQWAEVIGADPCEFERLAAFGRPIALAVDTDDIDGPRSRVALALARSWPDLSDMQLRAILCVVTPAEGAADGPLRQSNRESEQDDLQSPAN